MESTDLGLVPGMKFRYAGFGHTKEEADRTIEIFGCNALGELEVKIRMDIEDRLTDDDLRPSTTLHNVPIERVVWLVDNHIWFPVEAT